MTTDQTLTPAAALLAAADFFEQHSWHSDGTAYDTGRDAAITWVVSTLRNRAAVSSVGQAPATSQTAEDERAVRVLSISGAMCGVCGDEPGDRNCADCERVRRGYIADLRAAGWAPTADRAAVDAVRALHQPMQRGPFTICAHCSGWDGEWRCLGVVTNFPCPTIRALDGDEAAAGRVADDTQPLPRRGDAVEAWLKARRDEWAPETARGWQVLDEALSAYRLHADTGTPLSEHVCEGRAVGDCECLETEPAVGGAQQQEEQQHVGGNAEDCPACEGTNPLYPFICPGPPAATSQSGMQPAACDAVKYRVHHNPHSWEPEPDADLVRCPGFTDGPQ